VDPDGSAMKPGPGIAARALLAAGVSLGALLAIWFGLKEVIEPHWVIRLGDLVRPGPLPAEIDLGNGLSARVYADTRPHVGKITPVQKGLVLVKDGEELVEEGYGFGVPIVIYNGRSFLSQHAAVGTSPDGKRIIKRFVIDTEDTWTQLLRRKYRAVPPLGSIVFTHTITALGVIDVVVDFSGLRVQPELVYLANEQGAQPFTLYSDSSGVSRTLDDRPNTPDQWVPATADRTCFTALTREVRFCVETQPGQAKYVGRERYFQYRWSGLFRLSWAGTDIELARPEGRYRYRIVTEMLR
jgi:hypothetical protein